MAVVNVTVDVDLEEVATSDLLAELSARGKTMDMRAILLNLKSAGCPMELLSQLEAWAKLPIITAETLKSWKQTVHAVVA